ncbi:elongation factor P [Pontixanthobacter sp.]|uniref:elongation factor P n=1 Tax=Pontixanthobacter sp. TaxID=2792078 RepID=UPI003C7DB070
MIWKYIASLALMLPFTAPAYADGSYGKLGTLPHGEYICSIPGDAAAAAWIALPGKNFTIDNASTYHTEAGSGTYLMTGSNIVFTRGPMNGMRFQKTGSQTLRWIDNKGNLSRVRCIRRAGSL